MVAGEIALTIHVKTLEPLPEESAQMGSASRDALKLQTRECLDHSDFLYGRVPQETTVCDVGRAIDFGCSILVRKS